MDCTVISPISQHEVAVPSCVFWVILDYLTYFDYCFNLSRCNHAIWVRHLPDRVR